MNRWLRSLTLTLPVLALTLSATVGVTAARVSTPGGSPLDATHLSQEAESAPIIRIVSPLADSLIAPGEGQVGAGSMNGAGFALNLEIVTRDAVGVRAREGLNIRDTSLLGMPNPNIPALGVTFDVDLVTPDGGIIPAYTNLAALFNIAGVDDTPGPGVTIWAGWHVLESLPPDVQTFSIRAAITDDAGRSSADWVTLAVGRTDAPSGQALTPDPAVTAGVVSGVASDDGPVVTMIAPRAPTSVSTGPTSGNPSPPASGSLFFVQVTAQDRSHAGVSVKEGVILDGMQIQNPMVNPTGGPNRNFPGLTVTFDAPLRQPNGNVVPAGSNLAPIFNIAGSETDSSGAVLITADWVVGGTLVLEGRTSLTITAKVTDNAGHTGSASQVVAISRIENGQELTPAP